VPSWIGHPHQRLARALDALADRLGHLAGLAVARPDPTVAVTHHHQRAEAEPAAALDHLGHAVDVDDPVDQVEVVGIEMQDRHRLHPS
jgi:hypothetical protein